MNSRAVAEAQLAERRGGSQPENGAAVTEGEEEEDGEMDGGREGGEEGREE